MQDYKALAEKQIELGKGEELIRASLSKHFQEEDRKAWLEAQRADYEAMFPTMRDMTLEEKALHDVDAEGNPITREPDYVYPQVAIDYIVYDEDGSEIRIPSDYVTFDEYLNGTVVVIPEVLATYDADGLQLTPYEPEVTNRVREFAPKADYNVEIDEYLASSDIYTDRLRKEKKEQLDKLVITTNTVAYDANGKAIGNMSAVVGLANFKFNQALASGIAPDIAYQSVYKDVKVGWKGADNIVHMVQIESIAEALEAGMQEVAKVLGV